MCDYLFSVACYDAANCLQTIINYLFCCHAQVFTKGYDKDTVALMVAIASRIENQDAIDVAIVGMLPDPKEVNIFFFTQLY